MEKAEAKAAVATTSSKYQLTKIPLKHMKKTCVRESDQNDRALREIKKHLSGKGMFK